MSDDSSAVERLLAYHIDQSNQQFLRIGGEVHELRNEMRALVRVSEQQAGILERLTSLAKQVDEHEDRIRTVETDIPPLKETRKWLVAAAASAILALASAVGPKIISKADAMVPTEIRRPVSSGVPSTQ